MDQVTYPTQVQYKPPANQSTPIVNWLRREKRKGFAPIVVFCGRQRSGKTSVAMRIAWEVDPKFTYDRVCSDVTEFAKCYQKYNNTVIILDEASTSLFVYDWNSLFQRVFSIINDTQAFKQNIVFICLPMVHKLGKIHRYDVDAIIQVHRSKNPWTYQDEVFYKYQIQIKRYNDLSMRPPLVLTVRENCGAVPMCPPHLWQPYIEKGQSQFKGKILNDQLLAMTKKLSSNQPREYARLPSTQ